MNWCFISQKMTFFIVTAVKTSNLNIIPLDENGNNDSDDDDDVGDGGDDDDDDDDSKNYNNGDDYSGGYSDDNVYDTDDSSFSSSLLILQGCIGLGLTHAPHPTPNLEDEGQHLMWSLAFDPS
jgi:hypothetical protein